MGHGIFSVLAQVAAISFVCGDLCCRQLRKTKRHDLRRAFLGRSVQNRCSKISKGQRRAPPTGPPAGALLRHTSILPPAKSLRPSIFVKKRGEPPPVAENKKEEHPARCSSFGTPGWIRTSGLQSRSLSLYPTELRAHGIFKTKIL